MAGTCLAFRYGMRSNGQDAQRHYAVKVDGTVITFECAKGHIYSVDYSKRIPARRMSEQSCLMMFKWWSKERGGVSGKCRKCAAIARAEGETRA